MRISFASGDGDGDGRNPEVWGCDKKGGTVSLQLQSEEELLRYPALQHSLTSLSRESATAAKMCDGKSNRRPRHLLLILGLLWLISAARAREVASDKNENPIVIRGGLVFSEENPEGPIYVNQAHYLTTRTISLKHFSQAMQCTYDVLYTYDSHCKQTNKLFQTQSIAQANKPQHNRSTGAQAARQACHE